MSSLLEELKHIKLSLPEIECYVPEWERNVTLRGFTVREGRALRKLQGGDNEAFAIKAVAYSIADGDERPLANPEGEALIESLSELSVRKLMEAFGKITQTDLESGVKNSEPRAAANGSSTDSPSPSAEQLPN
jgi:hypothetical protein